MNNTKKILQLTSQLRNKGYHKHADELEYKYLFLKRSETNLYSVLRETGEDLLDQAHPEGSVKMEDAKDEGGVVETLLDQKKKIEKAVSKDPTGKLSAASVARLIKKISQEKQENQDTPAVNINMFDDAGEAMHATEPELIGKLSYQIAKHKAALSNTFVGKLKKSLASDHSDEAQGLVEGMTQAEITAAQRGLTPTAERAAASAAPAAAAAISRTEDAAIIQWVKEQLGNAVSKGKSGIVAFGKTLWKRKILTVVSIATLWWIVESFAESYFANELAEKEGDPSNLIANLRKLKTDLNELQVFQVEVQGANYQVGTEIDTIINVLNQISANKVKIKSFEDEQKQIEKYRQFLSELKSSLGSVFTKFTYNPEQRLQAMAILNKIIPQIDEKLNVISDKLQNMTSVGNIVLELEQDGKVNDKQLMQDYVTEYEKKNPDQVTGYLAMYNWVKPKSNTDIALSNSDREKIKNALGKLKNKPNKPNE